MAKQFDRRVVSPTMLAFIRACQERVPCHLGGGAALAGVYLRHRVDLYFLDRAGHPPEGDLDLALRKDAGIDPGVLAWLLSRFPTEPLPQMLEPLTVEHLLKFRDELAERLRKIAVR